MKSLSPWRSTLFILQNLTYVADSDASCPLGISAEVYPRYIYGTFPLFKPPGVGHPDPSLSPKGTSATPQNSKHAKEKTTAATGKRQKKAPHNTSKWHLKKHETHTTSRFWFFSSLKKFVKQKRRWFVLSEINNASWIFQWSRRIICF